MGLPPIEHICLFWTYTEAPSLRRSYPASSVLRTSPPPHTARPVSRELPVDPYRDHRWGFPCCVWSPLPTCHRHYPGRSDEACSLVPLHRLRPSLCNSQVGSCNCFFGACSAFTHVMACTLAESPCDPLHRKLRQLRCLRCRFDCYRVERTSSGRELHPLKSSAFHGALLRKLSCPAGKRFSNPSFCSGSVYIDSPRSWPYDLTQWGGEKECFLQWRIRGSARTR